MCKDTCALPFQFNPWRKFSELDTLKARKKDDILNIIDHLKRFWRVPLWIGQERSLKLYTTVNTYLELASVLDIGGSIFLFIRLFCKLDILLIPVLIQYIMRKNIKYVRKNILERFSVLISAMNNSQRRSSTMVNFDLSKFVRPRLLWKKPLVEECFLK